VLSKPLKLSLLYDRLLEIFGGALDVARAAAGEPSREPVAAPGPLRILVAEDNAVNQKVALRLLERLGYQADVSANGLEALDRLDRAPYDVVLMDVQMPGMDGLEASRAICARWPPRQRPRIIAMTAEAMEGDRERCLAAGMDDYLVKPVRLDELARALSRSRPLTTERTGERACGHDGTTTRDALDRRVLDQLREDLGDAAALRDVISTFLERSPSMLTGLREAAARGDGVAVSAGAHAMKGTSATLGALTRPPPTIPLRLAWPMTAPVLGDRFGPRGDRWHSGIDLPAPMGTPVYAARAGEVVWAGWHGAYGFLVAVAHGHGERSMYAHLSRIDVRVGVRIGRGLRVGLVGATGDATGPHLHFEVRVRGACVNPLRALP